MLETNRRVQAQNSAPKNFPSFVRRGYAIRVIADGYTEDEQGLIFKVWSHATCMLPAQLVQCHSLPVTIVDKRHCRRLLSFAISLNILPDSGVLPQLWCTAGKEH